MPGPAGPGGAGSVPGAAAVEAAVRAEGLLAPGTRVVVLLSGGRDSVCLLDLAVRICGPGAVGALHVDYGLRAGSAEDAAFCAALCAARGVSLAVEVAAPPPASGNRQAWARELRYAAARRMAAGRPIAVAHTASDQVETVLYRLISSPSRRALLGMAHVVDGLIRPLLSITRAETTAYCVERELAWVDDPSNDTPTYVRNRIRSELIPLLEELHPGAVGNILAVSEVLRAEAEVLQEQLMHSLAGRSAVPLREVQELPRGSARLLLQHLADAAREDGPAAGVAGRLAEVLAMSDDAMLDLPLGVRAVTRSGVLHFERTPPLER